MTDFTGFPVIIGWELTLACNLRCLHCASAAGSARNNELSEEEALAICEQLPSLLVQEVIFTGGEPLLSHLWAPLAERLRKLGIRPGMVTNATLFSAEVMQKMQDFGIGALAISLDGLCETHDLIRGSIGLYDRVVKGIVQALEANFELTVITTVNSRSIYELEAMGDFLQSLGVKRWQLQPLFAFGRSRENQKLHLTSDEYLKLGKFIHEKRQAGIKVMGADGVGYFSELDPDGPFPWRGCSAGISTCGIMSDGRVKGCLSWPDSLTEGNLRLEPLWDIWFRKESFAQTRNFSREDMGGDCSVCAKAEECGGGCSAMSLAATGKFHATPYCFRSIIGETKE